MSGSHDVMTAGSFIPRFTRLDLTFLIDTNTGDGGEGGEHGER